VHSGAVFLYQKATRGGDNDTGTTITASGYTLQTTLMPADLHAYTYFGHTIYFRDAIGTCIFIFYFHFFTSPHLLRFCPLACETIALFACAKCHPSVCFIAVLSGLVSAYDELGSGVVYLYEQTVTSLSGDAFDFQKARAYLCTGTFILYVNF